MLGSEGDTDPRLELGVWRTPWWGPGDPLALGSFSKHGYVEGGEGKDYGWRSGVNRLESRWQAAGLRHKLRAASSFLVIPEMRRQGRNLQQMGDQRHLEWAQGAQLLENEGKHLLLWGNIIYKNRAGPGPIRVDWWALAHIFWPWPIIPIHVSKTTGESSRNNMNGDKRWLLQAGPSQTSWAQRSEVLRPALNLESNFEGAKMSSLCMKCVRRIEDTNPKEQLVQRGWGAPFQPEMVRMRSTRLFKIKKQPECLFKVRDLRELHVPTSFLTSLLLF